MTAIYAFKTIATNQETGKRLARSDLNTPLGRWNIPFSALSDADKATLQTFFETTAVGSLNEFAFLDPMGNLVTVSEDFDDALWVKASVSETATGVSDPFGGTDASTITSSSSNGSMRNVILPTGNASGFVLTFSVWARVATGTQTLRLLFVNSDTNGSLSSEDVVVTTAWGRHIITFTLASSVNIGVRIGGGNTWGSSVAIDLYGAQAVSGPGPSGYAKTPGNAGLHSKCRFDQSNLIFRRVEPQRSSVQVRLREYV